MEFSKCLSGGLHCSAFDKKTVVTYFQRATRSFRASASIVVFLRRPPLRLTRASDQVSALTAADGVPIARRAGSVLFADALGYPVDPEAVETSLLDEDYRKTSPGRCLSLLLKLSKALQ